MSLVLRHKPETIGIHLDANGWVDVETLLNALAAKGHRVSFEELAAVVANNDKQRFVLADGRIRANQGHSIAVNLDLSPAVPPATLYHGTATRSIGGIRQNGLKPMQRQHVHLSKDRETATTVGSRHGKAEVLEIDAANMSKDGHTFWLSANGVWLVKHVPARYIGFPHAD